MPLQNRVTPLGEIIVTPARGAVMGNRGCLHDERRQIVRSFVASQPRWIYCDPKFPGQKRRLMAPGCYTELFFLDEATALAAGHRPCNTCLKGRLREFAAFWKAANPELVRSERWSVSILDQALQRERVGEDGSRRYIEADVTRLPAGTYVQWSRNGELRPHLISAGALWAWTPQGYECGGPLLETALARVITPLSVVRALAAGYGPQGLPDSQS